MSLSPATHLDDMAQREYEYRARFGARDNNCLYGREPVWHVGKRSLT